MTSTEPIVTYCCGKKYTRRHLKCGMIICSSCDECLWQEDVN